ncbi:MULTISPECIES: exonuclease SbcCD subunit D C-terminal domain-containing protein [Nocardia]|uniref:metallophosphoesterase family protein n=1 Tax=Nocardia TaxID=1817 RepID=UPI00135CC56E|nr:MULTISPECIES: exonuclease SbcCD subunit D C-terminal domain-containing protein [Nocardia]
MTARVFHTSDWHLGRQIGRHRRDAEFDAVLNEIGSIAADFAPDLIVHSGDLFDGHRPSLDDMRRAALALRRLGDIAPVVVVAGNHDTRHVLSFLEFMISDLGARTCTESRVRFATDARPGGLLVAEYPAAQGELTVRVGGLPYLHPNRFAYDFSDPATATATYAERMRAVQADVYRCLARDRGPRDVLVYAAHLFVEGATPSHSERKISIGPDFASSAMGLPEVDYGALGHIHKPQRIDGVGFSAHYAGSPLQMDFGEIRDTKSVVLAEIAPGREPRIELVALESGRRLVRLAGTLDQIRADASRVGDAWVKVSVHADSPVLGLSETLSEMLPKATIVGIDEYRPGAEKQIMDRTTTADDLPSVEEILREYLADGRVAGRALDHVMATLADIQADPDPADGTRCCEMSLLAAAIDGHTPENIDRAGVLTTGHTTDSEALR